MKCVGRWLDTIRKMSQQMESDLNRTQRVHIRTGILWNKESKLNAQTVEQKLEPIIQSTGCETVTQTQRRTERERDR